MTKENLKKILEERGIESSYLDSLESVNVDDETEHTRFYIPINKTQANGVISMCSIYQIFYDKISFGELVVKAIIKYSRNEVIALSSHSDIITRPQNLVAPKKEIPKYLMGICKTDGSAMKAFGFGKDFVKI